MNLGDGLLFELENGKPKLILLTHAIDKNPAKLSYRPRAANILSSRQPSCVEEVQGEERPARQLAERHRESKSKAEGAAVSFTSNATTTSGGRSTTLTSLKTHEHHKGGSGCANGAKVKSDRHKHNASVGSLRANGKTGQPQNSGTQAGRKVGPKDTLAIGDPGLKEVCLTSEQLQKILNTVQTSSNGQHLPEDHRTQGNTSKSDSSMNEGGGEKRKEEDRGGGEEIKKGEGGKTGTYLDKDNRSSGCLFSWLEERQSDSRAALDAKKTQWRRELDEQVALKQQQQHSAPGRLQAEEDTESVLSVQSSVSHREQPAAIRSSLRFGEVTPMEEVLSVERKEEQRRRWLEELDRQREEATERRRREKLLQSQVQQRCSRDRSQTEDHELWAIHFDSLQRRPPVQTVTPSAPPPAPSNGSERGEWEPSSSLSLVWEAMSSCGAESVGGTSVDTTSGYPARASYLRTMTALLDPAQIEERERRRLKQLEQQRAIEAQVEERRRQRDREEASRREEEEEEERRVALEREMLERRYKLDTQREKQKPSHPEEQPKKVDDQRHLKTLEPSAVSRHDECSEEEVVSSSASLYKDTAVQTEEAPSLQLKADRVQTPHVSAQYQPPPCLSAAPPNSRNRAGRTGKENIFVPGGGGDPYDAFARRERSKRDKRRPEWNTQRPSRRYVPASERYPAPLQRDRQESRLKRQAELLALQERTGLSRTDPPPPPPQHQEPPQLSNPTQTRTSPTRKVESISRGHSSSAAVNTERGRSPPVPAVRHRVQGQQAPPPTSPPPPPVLEFIPYVRTDEVFNLDPLEPADTPPPHTHTEAPPQSSASPPSHRDPLLHPELLRNTHRQQEILRGLAQLRQGLLQKQRELETDLNPLLKRHDN
ncbi:coiled-coil domain-containing protein 66 isoform X2 [Micropterus salmoides]|uniref:coiled-coil domain-containing protein 66 isoform X2 n=1 Tax=Micropterus salmoides TaxID=27706 RepID=UPI0018EE1488|nr:coiled-coil domain-containing protein 66 isoform X2 [Micropterus salmoides]